jgi:hypothetical protein
MEAPFDDAVEADDGGGEAPYDEEAGGGEGAASLEAPASRKRGRPPGQTAGLAAAATGFKCRVRGHARGLGAAEARRGAPRRAPYEATRGNCACALQSASDRHLLPSRATAAPSARARAPVGPLRTATAPQLRARGLRRTPGDSPARALTPPARPRQVPGCAQPDDTSTLRRVHQRARACAEHLKALQLEDDSGALVRFCQRCSKWEPLAAFEVRSTRAEAQRADAPLKPRGRTAVGTIRPKLVHRPAPTTHVPFLLPSIARA